MKQADVLEGLQWGDEGKGKITDALVPRYDIIARFQGGPNAGHTLEFEGIKEVLHLIPSGIFHKGKLNVLGSGMVIDPIAFKKEIEKLTVHIPLEELKKRIVISDRAKLILPTYRLLDQAQEAAKGNGKIGTTGKGIGPAYTQHRSRNVLMVGDIATDAFSSRFTQIQGQDCEMLTFLKYDEKILDLIPQAHEFKNACHFMQQFEIINCAYWLNEQMLAGKKVLCEGAQGALLDIDHGNYPFVTSSNTTTAGACTGLGIPPSHIGRVYGVFKAYATRVGSGPFPTELGGQQSEMWCAGHKREEEAALYGHADINASDEFIQGVALRTRGFEFGATTGRLRRTGWQDMPALKYAIMINGVTNLIMTKADILSGFKRVRMCDVYDIKGEHTQEVRLQITRDTKPIYNNFPGWDDIRGIKKYNLLPKELKGYISRIEKETQVPVSIISTGPDRSETIFR